MLTPKRYLITRDTDQPDDFARNQKIAERVAQRQETAP